MNTISSYDALVRLKEGNERFVSGVRSLDSLYSQKKMAQLAQEGQKPFAIVLTCSDSRSPVEMIFDQGLGDVFVVRVAGNVVAPSLLASIEFAAANFGCSLVVVMGHSKCGAVKATIEHVKQPENALPSVHLEELVSRIRPAVEKVITKQGTNSDTLLTELCTHENVKRSIRLIESQSEIIRDLMLQKKIEVRGAVLDIESGKVEFIESPLKVSLRQEVNAAI